MGLWELLGSYSDTCLAASPFALIDVFLAGVFHQVITIALNVYVCVCDVVLCAAVLRVFSHEK